jgi:hypothetical protein
LGPALVKDLRDVRAPLGAEEIEEFETDVLAGFVLARAYHDLGSSKIFVSGDRGSCRSAEQDALAKEREAGASVGLAFQEFLVDTLGASVVIRQGECRFGQP